jgi:hypothetical protein
MGPEVGQQDCIFYEFNLEDSFPVISGHRTQNLACIESDR